MRTLIVYESMYGNTHTIADEIAAALDGHGVVRPVPVGEADPRAVAWADLIVVGGPTHAHSLTSAPSRRGAIEAAAKPDSGLTVDPDAEGLGLREWFHQLSAAGGRAGAAFDTRFDGPPLLTGRASKGITRRLKAHGYRMVAEPESFLVDKANLLVDGEAERARAWGALLAATFAPAG